MERVLILAQEDLRPICEEAGLEPICASSVEEAIEILESEGTSLALVNLESEEGASAVERLRAAEPLIQVIVSAGPSRLSIILQALELGACEYVPQAQARPEALRAALRHAAERLGRWKQAMQEAFEEAAT